MTTMTRTDEISSVRAARLAKIRQEIADGTYETPERLSATVDALLADLEDRVDRSEPTERWAEK